jgi:hypothetical protein
LSFAFIDRSSRLPVRVGAIPRVETHLETPREEAWSSPKSPPSRALAQASRKAEERTRRLAPLITSLRLAFRLGAAS